MAICRLAFDSILDLMGQIKKSLIALNSTDERHARPLNPIDQDYTGFVEAADNDYDVIRKAMERAPGAGGNSVRNTRGKHNLHA